MKCEVMFNHQTKKINLNLFLNENFSDLFLKKNRYAVPDIPYSIGASVTQAELNTFINALLQENGDAKPSKPIDFEFIILNEFLR